MIASAPMLRPRPIVLACFVALIALGLAWELWLAPLRPGGSLLALKVLPLAVSLPSLWRRHLRTYQWWSMGILAYVAEGATRAFTDAGLGASLALAETLLATLAFGAILVYVRSIIGPRRPKAKPTPTR